MSSDAQALLQQLAEKPEVLDVIQNMLTLLRTDPPLAAAPQSSSSSSPSFSSAATAAAGAAVSLSRSTGGSRPHARPPRGGYPEEEENGEVKCTVGDDNNGERNTWRRTSAHPLSSARARVEGRTLSRPPSVAANLTAPAVTTARIPFLTKAEESNTSSPQQQQQLADAQRRIGELEKDFQRTAQRMEQLNEVVQQQKADRQKSSDRHALELEETRHAYDAVVRRKDEVQEEALRQLMRSRQLMVSAARYEAAVAAAQSQQKQQQQQRQWRNENESRAGGTPAGVKGGQKSASSSVRLSAAALNTSRTQHPYGSAVKRERPQNNDDDDDPEGLVYHHHHHHDRREQEEGEKARDVFEDQAHRRYTYSGKSSTAPSAEDGDEEQQYNNKRRDEGLQQQQQRESLPAPRRMASYSGGLPSSRARPRREKIGDDRALPSMIATTPSPRGTESPEVITALRPSPSHTAATATLRRSNGRPPSRRRRTPRTPSLTNADRLRASSLTPRSAPPLSSVPVAAAGSGTGIYAKDSVGMRDVVEVGAKKGLSTSALARRTLPGTASLKIDSPTPVVSAAWTNGRSLTGSRTPVPPTTLTRVNPDDTTANNKKNNGTMRGDPRTNAATVLSKPPLSQRTAGRLPPPPHTLPQPFSKAVPNTCSGASSVVTDGPTRSPSPVNPKRGHSGPRRFIFTGLKEDEPRWLTSAIEDVGDDGAVLSSELDEVPPAATTHIVLRGTPRSVKALCGVVAGKWLVSPDYIKHSMENGFWLDEQEEGGMRIVPPPLAAQRFLVTVDNAGIRAKLVQVIEYGGGEVMPMSSGGKVAQDVVVITSGDDLLRYATEGHM